MVLNLLRSKTSDMLKFMNRSMNQESMQNQLKSIESQMVSIEKDQSLFVPYYKVTIDESILEKYLSLKECSEYQSSKQRKNQKKELHKLRDLYVTIESESNLYKKMRNYNENLQSLTQNLNFIHTYNAETIHIFMDILYSQEFISITSTSETKSVQFKEDRPWVNINNTVSLTEKGIISIGIQEWNGVVAAEFLQKTNFLGEMTVIDIIKLFSCFTNIRVSDDVKTGYKNHKFTGSILEKQLDTLNTTYNKYHDIELKYTLNTGLEYEIHYDLLPCIEEWIESSDEQSCAKVLRSLEMDKKIFVGEFVKALLKIHTVGLELEKIAEETNHIDLLVKLREIPNLLLKYVVNTQSLYI